MAWKTFEELVILNKYFKSFISKSYEKSILSVTAKNLNFFQDKALIFLQSKIVFIAKST